MGLASIHPSQRRFSCEVCRRQKSKCQRIQRNDPKCARCTLLGVECTTGQQKKVGRPKQASVSAQKAPGSKSRSTAKESRTKPLGRQSQQSQQNPPGELQVSPSFLTLPVPALSLGTADAASAWPTIGTNYTHQDSLNWDIANVFDDSSPLSNLDSALNVITADTQLLDTADNNIYFAPPGPESAMGGIDSSDAMAKLSQINLDLHIRVVAATDMNRTILGLNDLLYQESPLFIDNYTVAELMLKTSQDFLQILTQLLNSQQRLQSYQNSHHSSTSTFSFVSPSQPLFAPLALTITSIFTQLIFLCELYLEHLTTRIERLSADPIAPIPGITFGGLPLAEPCMQGMFFSNFVVHLLERMERALGISEISGGGGLLSARQIDVLWSELDGGAGVSPGHGALRPGQVKKGLGRVARQLALVNKWLHS
ncbi:Zn(II)2Cys6 transcription factor domain-containing protein [Aspergillus puulaauensis]|uniref:Zn(2)-C6 fungal-type domain-containing protein n=1 Tax=Aspergillus puulaauensis TaxID=1220207 RepID=A0A7R8AK98_9EURO|nr:uncharacterized protein APUU_30256A [Aspergillus puulaauensis]BCS22031.1 hypothetical protein APUU_30256A [Aspergillus puulaauensis]